MSIPYQLELMLRIEHQKMEQFYSRQQKISKYPHELSLIAAAGDVNGHQTDFFDRLHHGYHFPLATYHAEIHDNEYE